MTSEFEQFSALHRPGSPLLLPNAWDFASAAILAAEGFPALGTTSLGVAAATGKPDAAGATLPETLALTRALRPVPALITVDVEGGFSDIPEEVAETVARFAGAGAAGINLEDGRADGTLRPAALHAEIIAAVKERVPATFINARTDAFWLSTLQPSPQPYDRAGELGRAVERAEVYVRAGADGIFVPGVAATGTIAVLAEQIAVPLNVLFAPGRHSVAELAALGVARISLGSLLLRAALQAVRSTARDVREGATEVAEGAPSYAAIAALLVK